MTNAKYTLLHWLSEGDLLRVCAGLNALSQQHQQAALSGQAALQAGRFRQLRSQQVQNLIDQEDYQHELAKTRQTLLDLIQGLPDDWPAEPLASIPPSESSAPAKVFPVKKVAIALVAGIVLLLAATQLGSALFSEKQQPEATPLPADTSARKSEQPTLNTPGQASKSAPEEVVIQREPTKVEKRESAQPSRQESRTPANPSTASAKPPASNPTAEVRQQAPPENDVPLSIRCRTNKGRSGQYYKSGSTVRLYATANQPCYLRSLYTLADGRIVLLEDNRTISAEQAGQEIEIGPGGFIVDAPYGQEQLYVFAQSAPFPALNIERTADGYDLVKDDLTTSLNKTRGLKKKQRFAEDRIFLETRL